MMRNSFLGSNQYPDCACVLHPVFRVLFWLCEQVARAVILKLVNKRDGQTYLRAWAICSQTGVYANWSTLGALSFDQWNRQRYLNSTTTSKCKFGLCIRESTEGSNGGNYRWKKDMFTGWVCKGSPFGEVNFRREATNEDLSVLPF